MNFITDDSKRTNLSRVVTTILAIAMAAVFVVQVGYTQIDNNTTYTYFPPGKPPGTLEYDSGSNERILYMAVAALGMAIVVGALLNLIGMKEASYATVILSGGSGIIFLVLAVVLTISGLAKRNDPNISTPNLADDKMKCCAPEYYNNPNSGCPNANPPTPCIAPRNYTTRETLGSQAVFVGTYTTLWVMGVGGIVSAAVAIGGSHGKDIIDIVQGFLPTGSEAKKARRKNGGKNKRAKQNIRLHDEHEHEDVDPLVSHVHKSKKRDGF